MRTYIHSYCVLNRNRLLAAIVLVAGTMTSTALGIYEETYFAGDELTMKSTSPTLSSCDVTLISRV